MDDRRMARWARATAVAVVCIAVLAGCTAPRALGDDDDLGNGFHLAQLAGGPQTKDRMLRTVRVSAPPADEYEWTVASVDPTSRDLRLFYTDGACTSADRLAVEETGTAVTIGITASKTFSGNCIAVGIPRSTTVVLEKPLGRRALMEGGGSGNSYLPTVADPGTLPSPTCSTADGEPSNVPVGMLDVTNRVAPTSATTAFVCRTWWPNGRVRMESTTIGDRTKVAALARALNAGTTDVAAGPAPVVPCPTRLRGSWYDVTFEGLHLQVQVHADEINCLTVTNGGLSGRLSPALAKTLDALFAN